MFCNNCGAQIEDESKKFCPFCGASLTGDQQKQYQDYNYQQAQQQYNQAQQQYNQAQQQMNNAQFFGNSFGIVERNIVTAIVLSIVTCGIYGLYWFICLTEDTNKLSGDPNATSGGMALVLTIVTCGIYGLYWMYKRGEILDNYNIQRGLPQSSNAILYLILSIFGLQIVSYCLMQNELNKISHGL